MNQKGGLRVGAGDIDADGRDEILTCFGPSNQASRSDILRYNPATNNIGYVTTGMTLGLVTGTNTYAGCRVAGGDINLDGKDDVAIVFDGANNALLLGLSNYGWRAHKKPFGSTFTGNMSVGVGDRNGDGYAELFLGQLSFESKTPAVKIFDGFGVTTEYYLPTPATIYPLSSVNYTGVWVGARDINGDGKAELMLKPRSVIGTSTYQALMGPSFITPWLNREELGIAAGGPIG